MPAGARWNVHTTLTVVSGWSRPRHLDRALSFSSSTFLSASAVDENTSNSRSRNFLRSFTLLASPIPCFAASATLCARLSTLLFMPPINPLAFSSFSNASAHKPGRRSRRSAKGALLDHGKREERANRKHTNGEFDHGLHVLLSVAASAIVPSKHAIYGTVWRGGGCWQGLASRCLRCDARPVSALRKWMQTG